VSGAGLGIHHPLRKIRKSPITEANLGKSSVVSLYPTLYGQYMPVKRVPSVVNFYVVGKFLNVGRM